MIVSYLLSAPSGPAVTGSDYEEMPRVHGAAIEELNFEKIVVILGRFNSRTECHTEMDTRVDSHLTKLDQTRTVKLLTVGCYQDPQT